MNREQKRHAAKHRQAPTKLLVGCVGAKSGTGTAGGVGYKDCGMCVVIPYDAFKHPQVLFKALQEGGWSLGISGMPSRLPGELIHSLLCPECTKVVLAGRTPQQAMDEADKAGHLDGAGADKA